MKIKNDDGTEVDVLTQEEVDTKLAAEKTAWEESQKGVVGEKDTTINNLAKEKSDLEKKLEDAKVAGIREDHPNFKILKDALATKDADINKLRSEIDEDKKTRKQDAWNALVKQASGGNEEFEKKVKLHLEKTISAMPETTPEERQSKLEAAIKLSSDRETPGMFDGGVSGGGFSAAGFGR